MSALNNNGTVAGTTYDGLICFGGRCPLNLRGSFVRSSNGVITIFGQDQAFAAGMNNQDQIVGSYNTFSFPGGQAVHGFIRQPGGAITLIDVPGALVTQATCVNDSGVIGGIYTTDTTGAVHGFIRTP